MQIRRGNWNRWLQHGEKGTNVQKYNKRFPCWFPTVPNISPQNKINLLKVYFFVRSYKIIINGKLIEQVNSFKYLGCNIATLKMNMDLKDITEKYNKLNGIIRRHFGENMRPQICKNAQCAEQTSHDVWK
jgi:hypothetical protein